MLLLTVLAYLNNKTPLLITCKGNLTPFAKQAIKEMSSHGYRMEYFRDAELLVDVTEHKLVPGVYCITL